MAGTSFSMDMTRFIRTIDNAADMLTGGRTKATRAVSQMLVKSTINRFETETDPEGKKQFLGFSREDEKEAKAILQDFMEQCFK